MATTAPTAAYGGDDGNTNNPTTILKRKRTKRQRPTTNATHSSPPSYSDFSTTTEDEDTANCLILLSKGHNNIITSPITYFSDFEFKFNSKKYIQTSTDSSPNGFTYVYECKTCSRTFPSFQALGGHRASHTKPKIIQQHIPKPSQTFSNEDEPSRSPQLQLNQSVSSSRNIHKLPSSKLHECSICCAEFNSGQALGGHMRRHRAANANTNTTLSLIPYSYDQKSTADDGLCLDLDLNLPAPLEINGGVSKQDQQRESSYKLSSNQNKQQPSVYLSVAPTLVDCYY